MSIQSKWYLEILDTTKYTVLLSCEKCFLISAFTEIFPSEITEFYNKRLLDFTCCCGCTTPLLYVFDNEFGIYIHVNCFVAGFSDKISNVNFENRDICSCLYCTTVTFRGRFPFRCISCGMLYWDVRFETININKTGDAVVKRYVLDKYKYLHGAQATELRRSKAVNFYDKNRDKHAACPNTQIFRSMNRAKGVGSKELRTSNVSF